MTEQGTNTLTLEPVAGPELVTIHVGADEEATIGRSRRSDFTLASDTVSRDHAVIQSRGGRWLLEDSGSRHGTYLNAQQLQAKQPTVLGDGDLVRMGPYAFRVSFGAGSVPATMTRTIADQPGGGRRIERVSEQELERLARHRLDLLVDCAAMIHSATNEATLAEAVLQSALAGTGFHHAALIRPRGGFEELEVLGYRSRDPESGSDFEYSRSLIEAASAGQIVRLTEMADLPVSVSIAELGITAALCAPIPLGQLIAAHLYLDARGGGPANLESDAAGFCQVIARMCGLAMSNLKRLELERRHLALRSEIDAAREAQKMIVPVPNGVEGRIRYAMQMRPGRFVAGDLFDVIRLDEDRTAVCIGDVTGEGVGAGVIMTAAQAQLHEALLRNMDAVSAVQTVNAYLCDRLPADKFVSLWVGIFNAKDNICHFVDAGHGHILFRSVNGGIPKRLRLAGGIPLGIELHEYPGESFAITEGDRVIVYSDGLTEQRNSDNQQFGWERVAQALEPCEDCDEDVKTVMAAISKYAGSDDLDDDTTVASIQVLGS